MSNADRSEVSVIVMAVSLSQRMWNWIKSRIVAGLCIRRDCDKPIFRRGLCSCHYGRYRAALMELPKKDRPSFEAKMIEKGLICEDRQGRRSDVENDYRELAEL